MTNELTQIITNFILITKNQNTFLKNYTLFLIFNIQVEKTFIFHGFGFSYIKNLVQFCHRVIVVAF